MLELGQPCVSIRVQGTFKDQAVASLAGPGVLLSVRTTGRPAAQGLAAPTLRHCDVGILKAPDLSGHSNRRVSAILMDPKRIPKLSVSSLRKHSLPSQTKWQFYEAGFFGVGCDSKVPN